jgi:hypothetical protein
MVGYAGSRERSRPWLSGVRERVAICLLAMLLAVMDLSWLPPLPLSGGPATTSTTVRISGTWFDMECSGRGSSTVVIYGRQSITVVINDDVKSELARVVRLCVLTVSEGAVRMEIPPRPGTAGCAGGQPGASPICRRFARELLASLRSRTRDAA